MKKILIGLHGPTGVGKDEVARIMLRNHGAMRLAFGDALKTARQHAFGLTDEWLRDDHKTMVHPYWGITPREMDQKMATEGMRNVFGQDFWVRRLQLDYLDLRINRKFDGPVVITDVRYNGEETESNWIRQQGGVVVHIKGPQRRADVNHSHVSNVALPVLDGDLYLPNMGTLEDLESSVLMLMAHLTKLAEAQSA